MEDEQAEARSKVEGASLAATLSEVHPDFRSIAERALHLVPTEPEPGRPPKISNRVADAAAAEVEEARAAGGIGYMARLLVQVTMPHSEWKGNEYERTNGKLTVRMLAPSKPGLPYGSYPRLLLSWITTEAVISKSRELELGDSLSTFMRTLGIIPPCGRWSGGRWGSVPRLHEHMKRLFGTTVSWTWDNGDQWVDMGIRPIEKSRLWWDPKRPDQTDLWKSTITLNPTFYEEIISNPVPIDVRVLKELARMRSPLAIDVYVWLTHRMSYLRKETTIPWPLLMLQFGGDYKLVRQFKVKFLRWLKVVKELYPTADVGPAENGLVLRPSRPHVPREALHLHA